MDIAQDLYKEELLEHYRSPQNYGKLHDADVAYHDFNPVCGDEIEVYLKMDGSALKDIKFTGKGCAISQAAASIVTEHLKGKKPDDAKKMTKEEMLGLLPIEVSHLRIKCALLAMKAIQKAIIRYQGGKNERT